MPDETRPNWMTEELLAHRDFSAVLASFAAAWSIRLAEHDEAIKRINAEIDKETEQLPGVSRRSAKHVWDDARAKIEKKHRADLDQQTLPADAFRRRVEGAEKHKVLVLTRAEADEPKTAEYLPAELVEMARLAGRIKIVGPTPNAALPLAVELPGRPRR